MDREWVADPTIAWRILLTARAAPAPEPAVLGTRLAALCAGQGWPALPVEQAADPGALQRALTGPRPGPVVLGLAGPDLVVSAHHSAVDGLGLLAVLAAVLDRPVRSAARGVADRPTAGGLTSAGLRRLREAVLAPPARVAAPLRSGDGARGPGEDVLADLVVAGEHRTADLVHAATRAVLAHNRQAGGQLRRVAVAVGAARPSTEPRIADRSALIRLRGVERMDRRAVAEALRSAPLQPPVAVRGRSGARVLGAGLRVLASRLGSTLLVSHLGRVDAPGVDRLTFHPVTAGAGGLSVGAVGLGGRTVLGLRARAADWDREGLQRLLRGVAAELRAS